MNWGRGLVSGEVALREGAGQGDKTCKTWKWKGGCQVQEVEVEDGLKRRSAYEDAVMWPTLYRKGKLRRSWRSCALVLQCVRPQDTLWVLALLPFIAKDTIFPAYSGETRQGSRCCFCLEALRWHDRTLCTRLPESENVWPHRYLGGNETHNVENSQHPTKVFKNYCLATQLCIEDTFEWALRKDLLITGTRHGLMLNPAHFLFSWD